MTTVIDSHTSANYYIVLELRNSVCGPYYRVQVCPRTGECTCGYPIRGMSYTLDEKEKARATFRRYKKKYV